MKAWGFGLRAMRAALVVAVALAMATQSTAGLARPPTLRRWALSTCEVRARERLNASGSNFAGTGDRDQQECSTIDHLSGQCSPSFTDGTGDGAELIGITYLVSPELAPESIAAPRTLPPQLSVTLTSGGIVCSAGVTTIALVVIGGMCMWRSTRGKHYRAAATMQAAARGFLARLLYQAMHMSLALREIQRVARGMLARRRAAHWRRFRAEFVRTIPRRAAFTIQAAARGFLTRRAMARLSLKTSLTGVSTTNHSAHALVDGPTMAPVTKGTDGPTTPRTVKAKKARKRGGVKTSGAKKAAAAGMPNAPHAVPGVINFKMPETMCGCGARLAMRLFPYMLPMADFPEAKCNVLREVIVARMERIGWTQPGFLDAIESAIHAEDLAKQAHPERHPGGSSTALVRFLGDYLKQVEHAEALVAARGDVYVDFVRVIDAYRAAREAAMVRRREDKAIQRGWNMQSGSGTDSDSDGEDPIRLTDSQLLNIYRKGNATVLGLLSVSDRVRIEHLLSEAAGDDAATKSAAQAAAGGVQA